MPWSFFFRPARIWIGRRLGLVRLVLAFVCGLTLVSEAWADLPVFSSYSVSVGGYPGSSTSSPQDACSQSASKYMAANPGSTVSGSAGGVSFNAGTYSYNFTCTWTFASNGNTLSAQGTANTTGKCADGTAPINGYCKGTCGLPGTVPGWNVAYGTSTTQTVLGRQVCVGGCAYNFTNYWTGNAPGQNGYQAEYQGPISAVGTACSGSELAGSSSAPSTTCPDKTYQGTVNGQNVCVPYPNQTTGTSSSSSTTDSPTGGTSTSNTSNTSTTTTCDGVTCSTTTVVTGGGTGGSGGSASGTAAGPCQTTQVSTGATVNGGAGTCTTTTTQPQTDYCKQNPTAQQCKASQGSASGGADCTAPPSCDGDAISCAILSQQWNTRCDLQKSVDPSIQLGQQIQAGNDPMAAQLPTPGKAEQVDMSSKFSNVDDMGFAAQCLPDLNIPLSLPGGATTLHIDMEPLCNFGKLFGYLNMLSTLMLCAYMLKGSF